MQSIDGRIGRDGRGRFAGETDETVRTAVFVSIGPSQQVRRGAPSRRVWRQHGTSGRVWG